MPSIAVQTKVGEVGSKATTILSQSYASLCNTGKFQYGFNSEGIFQLNTGEQHESVDFERSFTIASSDFLIDNLKRFRVIFIGVDADEDFSVSVMGDDKVWRNYLTELTKTGLQEIRVPVGRDGYGRYWKIKITSISRFRIDTIKSKLIVRPLGIRG